MNVGQKTNHAIFHFFLCAITAVPLSVFAHVDRILVLKGSSLEGLPSHYSPARFDPKDGILAIGKHQMRFTPYLQAFFPEDVPYGIHVSASWYHNQSLLPYYLLIRVYPNQKEDFSYQLLFNLDTLDLISVTIEVKVSPAMIRQFPVAVTEEQKKEISRSISKLEDKTSR